MEGIGRLHALDYSIIVGFFAIVVFIGFYFMKYMKKAKDYFAAGSAVPWWIAGTSLWMAGFSAPFFVIYGEMAYNHGWTAITFCWTVVPAMFFAGIFFAQRWRRARIITPLGFIENRYSALTRQIFVWTGIPLRVIDNAIRIFATAIFITAAVGTPWFTLTRCIVIVSIIMILYTYLGGQWAVIVTDFVQAIILVIAVVVIFILSMSIVGGFGNFINQSPDGFFRLLSPNYDWFYWAMALFLVLQSYNAGWSYVQKFNCARSDREARKMAFLSGALYFIGPVIFFIPAMIARVVLPQLENPQFAYAAISLKVLPVGMLGIMIAGIMSASLSSLGSDYNVLSGVLTNDFYKRIINPKASEKRLVLMGRLNTLILGALIMGFAIGIQYMKGLMLFDIMMRAFTAFGPAIMLPLLGGLLVKKINARGALCGIFTGMIIGLSLVIINFILIGIYQEKMSTDPTLDYWLRSGYIAASIGISILATIGGMIFGSRLYPRSTQEKERAEKFFKDMTQPYKVEKAGVEPARTPSPFYIIGLALLLLGFLTMAVGFIVLVIIGDNRGFWINIIVSAILILLGIVLYQGKKIKKSAD